MKLLGLGWKKRGTGLGIDVNLEDKSLLVVSDAKQMITAKTPYEELVARIQEENDSPAVLEKNLKRDIFREIMSVYFWSRTKLKFPHRIMTLEEFEIVRNVIESKHDMPFRPDYYSGPGSWGNFEDVHPFRVPINGSNYNRYSYHHYHLFDPESATVADYIVDDRYSLVFPPNIIELMNEIYAKRYPESSEKEVKGGIA